MIWIRQGHFGSGGRLTLTLASWGRRHHAELSESTSFHDRTVSAPGVDPSEHLELEAWLEKMSITRPDGHLQSIGRHHALIASLPTNPVMKRD